MNFLMQFPNYFYICKIVGWPGMIDSVYCSLIINIVKIHPFQTSYSVWFQSNTIENEIYFTLSNKKVEKCYEKFVLTTTGNIISRLIIFVKTKTVNAHPLIQRKRARSINQTSAIPFSISFLKFSLKSTQPPSCARRRVCAHHTCHSRSCVRYSRTTTTRRDFSFCASARHYPPLPFSRDSSGVICHSSMSNPRWRTGDLICDGVKSLVNYDMKNNVARAFRKRVLADCEWTIARVGIRRRASYACKSEIAKNRC